ncbi:hypothetical protein LF1_07260 [Rubripirellula obstinata]|uniref:Uncharacterized protein n=1 Tax=Rubripirellula obstinata TaxID=406547 RepID=A0A5B1CF54_9BACT|nr:hypothetical protein LF1_07260 [Rubripirellula obstinata]
MIPSRQTPMIYARNAAHGCRCLSGIVGNGNWNSVALFQQAFPFQASRRLAFPMHNRTSVI